MFDRVRRLFKILNELDEMENRINMLEDKIVLLEDRNKWLRHDLDFNRRKTNNIEFVQNELLKQQGIIDRT